MLVVVGVPLCVGGNECVNQMEAVRQEVVLLPTPNAPAIAPTITFSKSPAMAVSSWSPYAEPQIARTAQTIKASKAVTTVSCGRSMCVPSDIGVC